MISGIKRKRLAIVMRGETYFFALLGSKRIVTIINATVCDSKPEKVEDP